MNVIVNLVRFEADYVDFLENQLIPEFIEPLQARRHDCEVMQDPKFAIYFGTLTSLPRIHANMLAELKEFAESDHKDSAERLAGLMFRQFKLFRCYVSLNRFSSHAKRVVSDSNQLRRIINCKAVVEMMCQIVQRVPKYAVHVRKIMNLLEEQDELVISEQFQQVFEDLIEDIAKAAMASSNIKQIMQLQGRFLGNSMNLLKVGRELIFSGSLLRITSKGKTKQLMAHVFSDIFIYSYFGPANTLKFQGEYSLDHFYAESLPLDDRFHGYYPFALLPEANIVKTVGQSYLTLLADSEESRKKWVRSINRTVRRASVPIGERTFKTEFAIDMCSICDAPFGKSKDARLCPHCERTVCAACSPYMDLDNKKRNVCSDCYFTKVVVADSPSMIVDDDKYNSTESSIATGLGSTPSTVTDAQFANEVVKELVETESVYVEKMGQLFDGFASCLLELSFIEKSFLTKTILIEMEDGADLAVPLSELDAPLAVFLGEIEMLYFMHKELLSDLRMAAEHPNRAKLVVNIFSRYSSLFMLYEGYSKHFSHASRKFKTKGSSLSNYVKSFESQWDEVLESILIRPIQRLPRYELLLKQLKKEIVKSGASTADVDSVQATIESLQESIAFVNQNSATPKGASTEFSRVEFSRSGSFSLQSFSNMWRPKN